MKKIDNLYAQTIKTLLLYVALVLATRYIGGIAIAFMVLLALIMVARKKIASAISYYALILLLIEINPNVVSLQTFGAGMALRFGLLIVGFAMAVSGMSRPGNHRMPMGVMIVYLMVAALSSIGGFCPTVSYLKLVNFLVFFLSIWIGTQNLHVNRAEMVHLRATFLAIALFIVVGSILLLPFPGISTLNGLQYNRNYGVRLTQEEINAILVETAQDGLSLFCGITHQSQVLGPLAPCLLAWVLCDMLFVERRLRYLHLGLIILTVPIVYMTRSRVGLLSLVTALSLILFYLPKKQSLTQSTRKWVRKIMSVGVVVLVVAAVVSEIDDHAITRWIRKTDDVRGDGTSMAEAFTASRMGKVEENMEYFSQNPFLGKGFQVNWESSRYDTGGLILSAPIEKGVAPLMILGETGLLGAVVFVVFLIVFYLGCSARGLHITAVFFTIMFVTNLGEATIFSPGGLGGELWMICVVGGFTMDSAILSNRRHELAAMQAYDFYV